MRFSRLLSLLLLAAAPIAALAVDAPHTDGLLCSSCHMGHNAPGGNLTHTLGNANLCQSCHLAQVGGAFGFPWSGGQQAVPGVSGSSHRWDAHAANLGATPPNPASADAAEKEMGQRLEAGKLMCSTCHDQHQADVHPPAGRGNQHVSGVTKTGAGTGTVTVTSVAAASTAKAYLIDITSAGNETTARFRLSNDNGTSWFGCSAPGVYVAYVASPSNACTAGPAVQLNDGANVVVAFGAGTYVVGGRHLFYVSYPYLRADNTDARMCLTCHPDRHQYWQDVEGGVANSVSGGRLGTVTLGTTVFHHPVGQELVKTYDRGAPIDASGVAQTPGDGNPTNDLRLGTGGVVTCLTCHHPHNADSNSLTTDAR